MKVQHCLNCKFCITKNGCETFCCRYPPTFGSDYEGDFYSFFPDVDDTDWCGEWKQKPQTDSDS